MGIGIGIGGVTHFCCCCVVVVFFFFFRETRFIVLRIRNKAKAAESLEPAADFKS